MESVLADGAQTLTPVLLAWIIYEMRSLRESLNTLQGRVADLEHVTFK